MVFFVKGFRGAAVAAGIKYQHRLDLGMIVSEVPANAAAVFTKNVVKAAPVLAGIEHMRRDDRRISAVVVNSGNANACNGSSGMKDYMAVCGCAADLLGLAQNQVVFSSTGVIGEPLPVERFMTALPEAAESLSGQALADVADAILTTDTVRKISIKRIDVQGVSVSIAGMAKGAGMIGPDMGLPQATMLCFVMSDAVVGSVWWQHALQIAVNGSFNRILVDGDTSTNDTVYALANGLAGNHVLSGEDVAAHEFQTALTGLLKDLALQIVRDGEGATKCVSITVIGASSYACADRVARTIAESPLVKTAFFGQDPNWGRIFAAAGRAGVIFNPDIVNLWIDDVHVAKDGAGTGSIAEQEAARIMTGQEFSILLDLGAGSGMATVYTCDLSDEYVHINADYRT